MQQATLQVSETSCGHCKATVEGELNGLNGVEHSNTDLENGTAVVRYDEDRVTTGDLKGAIEESGYAVEA